MNIDAFIFDIGNVLLRFDYRRAHEAMRAAGHGEPDMRALEDLARRYERGETGRADFLRELAGIFRHRGGEDVLIKAWQEIFEPNYPMWEVVEKLHERYPLYLLSNTNCLQHDYIASHYEIFRRFSDGIYSYRAKLLKPELEIFRLAIERFGVRPETTIYIDDLVPNVEGAAAAGLQAMAYHPDSHERFLDDLRARGVQCV